MARDRKYYCVYIMGSVSGTLYIGISGNLHRRVFQHKFHHFEGFTDRYDVTCLLYWESYDEVYKALDREKQLKGWARAKKISLIARRNPHWVDLAAEWYSWMESEDRDASTLLSMTKCSSSNSPRLTSTLQNSHPKSRHYSRLAHVGEYR